VPVEEIECDTSKSYHADDSCFPVQKTSETSWSLKEVFGRPIKGACPLEDGGPQRETVCINAPLERTIEVRSEVPTSSSQEDEMRCFELPEGADWDVFLPEQKLEKQTTLQRPRMYAARSINGYGQERGSIQAVIANPSATESIDLVYLESLPWYMKPYLHTLRTSLSGFGATPGYDPVKETYYRPALDRHRGTHLEVLLTVPPASTLTLTYDFEKAILRYTEYPPDANRGFDVAAAVIRLLPPANSSKESNDIYLRTTSLLLPLPTPDFSMPYNVIILTSTVMALGFGSIFNLLVRRLVAADEVGPAPIALAIGQLRERVKAALQRVVGKVRKPTEKKVQ
jgi:phosphatidylinositol glycan class T